MPPAEQQARSARRTRQAVTAETRATGADPYAIPAGQALDQPSALTGAGAVDADTDQDGLTDAFEKLAGTSLTVADSDADGLSDGYEALKSRTDPLATDTDNDGMGDAQEVSTGERRGQHPWCGRGRRCRGAGRERAERDHRHRRRRTVGPCGAGAQDRRGEGGQRMRDSLSDAMEVAIGSNPLLADTDNDGMSDAVEVQYGMDPLAPGSSLRPAGQARESAAPIVMIRISIPNPLTLAVDLMHLDVYGCLSDITFNSPTLTDTVSPPHTRSRTTKPIGAWAFPAPARRPHHHSRATR